MTRSQMVKRSFKPYMVLELENHKGTFIDVILVATDFDNEVFTIRPLDIESFNNDDIHVSI